jgi:hypothetical protein
VIEGEKAKPPIRHDPLHAMQFRPAQVVQVSGMWPASRPSPIDRECPLHAAGDRCLWHVGGTAGENDDARSRRQRLRLAWRVRPVLVTVASWARARRARGRPGTRPSAIQGFSPRSGRVRCGYLSRNYRYSLSRPVLLGWLTVDPMRKVVSHRTRLGCLAAAYPDRLLGATRSRGDRLVPVAITEFALLGWTSRPAGS